MVMRKQMLIGIGMFMMATQAFGEFNSAELLNATKIAIEDFEASNPGHAEHFIGYKAWKSGADAKVKIYVDHGGMEMEFNYLCQKHEETTECHTL